MDEPTPPRPTVLLLVGLLGSVGGAERHMVTLARLLGERFNVVLVHIKQRRVLLDDDVRASLQRVEALEVPRGFSLRGIRQLAQVIDECGADVVLCANPFPLAYAQAARIWARRRYRVVEIYHTTVLRSWSGRLNMLFYRPLFWLAHQLVFVCETQRRHWAARGVWARRVTTIHNGVDTERFRPDAATDAAHAVRRRYGFADDDLVVGLCAVFRPEKAHLDLLEAVARLKREGLRWRVLLIGDGKMRPTVERAIERLELGDQVRITGLLADVRPEISACDAVALVSTAIETFSIAALEAMAMGKPMVMSDIGGAREQVADGSNGFLFPPGDVEALAACLRKASDRTLLRRMGQRARARVEGEYSEPAMRARYTRLIDDLMLSR
jgi:glycosyltransferase involved in cell wall biosynthesis